MTDFYDPNMEEKFPYGKEGERFLAQVIFPRLCHAVYWKEPTLAPRNGLMGEHVDHGDIKVVERIEKRLVSCECKRLTGGGVNWTGLRDYPYPVFSVERVDTYDGKLRRGNQMDLWFYLNDRMNSLAMVTRTMLDAAIEAGQIRDGDKRIEKHHMYWVDKRIVHWLGDPNELTFLEFRRN